MIVARLLPGCAPADLDACRALEAASFPRVQHDLASELALPHVLLWAARSAEGQPPAGFLLAWWLAGELEIQTVAVDPSRRRGGVGAALVAAALAEARTLRCERLLLEVRASNEAALALYRRAGFSEDGRRRGYYSEPTEDAVLMSRTLPG